MSSSVQLVGKVYKKYPVQDIKGSPMQRILVETGGDFSQILPVEFWKAKVDLLKEVNEGDAVEVEVNLRGKLIKEEYYMGTPAAWKIKVTEKTGDLPF